MLRRTIFLSFFPFLAGAPALAESPASAPPTQFRIAAFEQAVRSTQSAGDNA